MNESEINLQNSLAELVEKSQKNSNEINATVFIESPLERIDVRISPTEDDDVSGIVLATHVPASKTSKAWLTSALDILVGNAVKAMQPDSEFKSLKVSRVIERNSPTIYLHISDLHSKQDTDVGVGTTELIFEGTLTPDVLIMELSPCIKAIAEFQGAIDEASKRETNEIVIRAITYNSPISVSLDGASDAIQAIKETVVPWRRKHAEEMAFLLQQEKLAEIESKKAEVLEIRARAAKERVEKERLVAEVAKNYQEAEKLKLENQKLRLDLDRARVTLVLDIVRQVSPDLQDEDRITLMLKILPSISRLISSTIEIIE